MKKIINFFKLIFNFFDRCLIIPITKVIFKITKSISKPNRRIDTWLSKSTTLLFLY